MDSDEKLISIGLPIVKINFLKKSIECCLSQTYRNFEIIIQNNAADDITKSKIRELISKYDDARIKYFETEKQIPMVQNWNKTLEYASGYFFTILCDDDTWEPTFLEEIILLSKKYENTNIFHSRIAIINESDEILRLSPTCPEYEDGIDFIMNRLGGYRTIYLSDFVVKTKSIRDINGFVDFPDGWGSDVFTWFKIALNGGIAYTSKNLFNYRVSQVNVSNSKNVKNKHKAVEMQYVMLKEIIVKHKFSIDKYSKAKSKILDVSLNKFKDKNKKFLFYQLLINKYKLPLPIALGLSYLYQYIKRIQFKMSK